MEALEPVDDGEVCQIAEHLHREYERQQYEREQYEIEQRELEAMHERGEI